MSVLRICIASILWTLPGFAPLLTAQVAESDPRAPTSIEAEVLLETESEAEPTQPVRVEHRELQQPAESAASPPAEIIPQDYLVIPAAGRWGRVPIHRDPIELSLVSDTWKQPSAGDSISDVQGGRKRWQSATADEEGTLERADLTGGYAYTTFHASAAGVMLLAASGHAAVYVNGECRAGDPYRLGHWVLPVAVEEGENSLLFHLASNRLTARLVAPEAALMIRNPDATLPDLVDGMGEQAWGAIVVLNATNKVQRGLVARCGREDGETQRATPLPTLAPLSATKIPFRIDVSGAAGTRADYRLRILSGDDDRDDATTVAVRAETQLALTAAGRDAAHRRTFRSGVDGSVQSYALRPASDGADDPAALIVSLHGAAIDARKQLDYYQPKSWAHVLAPMGRRRYGFDWEDWSRQDVMEAIDQATQVVRVDPTRIYLTGHAMGGHGVWHLGATYPDRFAAIGPAAGWCSFWTYGGGMPQFRRPSDIQTMLLRAANPSDTLKLRQNFIDVGVYMLHGAQDRQVPVAQARFMRGQLAAFHNDFAYYEKSDAPHWWGAETCDWPAMMSFFRHHRRRPSSEKNFVDFTTVNPAISSRRDWVGIEAQVKQFAPSRIVIRRDPQRRQIVGQSQNVARLVLDVADLSPGEPLQVQLDEQSLPPLRWPAGERLIWCEQHFGRWLVAEAPSRDEKGPHRYGSLKRVFRQRPLLVYGTRGDAAENAWSLAKARFDAESFLYRGNGLLEVISDTEFRERSQPDRNVVLYGNADTNAAWPALLSTCPIQVRRSNILFGTRPEKGADLACLFVRPRPQSDTALVAAICGTGPAGFRTTNRLRYFVSGIAYPDVMLLGSAALTVGTDEIRALGFFGNDWRIETGEIAWRDMAL